MSGISLNISGKIDRHTIALYRQVLAAADRLRIPLIVIGASARDIVLHYGHGARIERATRDIDFGIEVPHWEAFYVLRESLLKNGFKTTKAEHRIISPDNTPLDFVPFGPVQDEHSNIAWPPDGDSVMNVLGFQEAYQSAEMVRIQDDPVVDILVATPVGITALKLIAWLDRAADLRPKDAKDLLYLFTTYERIPETENWCYQNIEVMEKYDWDLTLASVNKLGRDTKKITLKETQQTISQLFKGSHKTLSIETLIDEMCERRHSEQEYERNKILLNAFISGFQS